MTNVIHDKCDRLFAFYDTDGNGRLDRDDVNLMVGRVLAGSHVPLDSPKAAAVRAEYDAWWQSLVDHADTDADGVITQDEFRTAMSGLSPDRPAIQSTVRKAVDATFTAMDTDDDNQIPVSVVVAMFTSGGLSHESAAEAARVLDINGDGTITRDEYATAWLGFFLTDDPDAPASRILGKLS
ncbi:EF-hand domain-containing protein [Streptomyces sp. NPDC058401]|uniref:EF-hand domain-containing protein n=1 Tax=Streptomyces sp. NPDC058401 TaxID=3346480 RepID=UPI0036563128